MTAKRMDFSRYPRLELPKDETLFFEDEDSRELYILLHGELGVYRDEILVATMDQPLAIVGEMSALTDAPRAATVRALHNSSLIVIDDPAQMLDVYPQMGLKLARLLASRVAVMNDRFIEAKGLLNRAMIQRMQEEAGLAPMARPVAAAAAGPGVPAGEPQELEAELGEELEALEPPVPESAESGRSDITMVMDAATVAAALAMKPSPTGAEGVATDDAAAPGQFAEPAEPLLAEEPLLAAEEPIAEQPIAAEPLAEPLGALELESDVESDDFAHLSMAPDDAAEPPATGDGDSGEEVLDALNDILDWDSGLT